MNIGEARRLAIRSLSEIVMGDEDIERAVLGHDLFGLLRAILWLRPGGDEARARARVSEALAPCGRFWTGDIWVSGPGVAYADSIVYNAAWEEGTRVPEVDELRIDDRTRTRTGWLPRFQEPPWEPRLNIQPPDPADTSPNTGPPIVVFYSFKGGVGRTTALASFAIQRARQGERVLVIDLDLDAPGAGTLLSPDEGGGTSRGVVDYLLEAPLGEVDVTDFVHACRRQSVAGDAGGEILVMPAGHVDEDYLVKLSRVDVEMHGVEHPLGALIDDARNRLRPHWILLDSRAGLSPAAGILLNGIAHVHVLFGTSSSQNQLGMKQVIRHLGEERVRRDLPQARCIVIQAMIVDVVEVERLARSQFNIWLETTLRDHYMVADDEDPEDRFWSVQDLDSAESPGRAIPIPYRPRLAFFSSVDDVADDLVTGPYLELGSRLAGQFAGLHRAGEAD
jgi:hypothetical protein